MQTGPTSDNPISRRGRGPSNVIRPVGLFGPIRREPRHRLLEIADRRLEASVGVCIEPLPLLKDHGRNTRTTPVGEFTKAVGDDEELSRQIHVGTYAAQLPHCQR